MKAIESFLKQNNIKEVESTLPDMTGNARGKFYPTNKFLTEDESKIPESILIQTVDGEWGDNFEDVVDPTDKDMILVPDPNSIRLIPWTDEPTANLL